MTRGPAAKIILGDRERSELEMRARRRKIAWVDAVPAEIVLLAADGMNNCAIAATLGLSGLTVGLWRKRFAKKRFDGLDDEPRCGAPRKIGDEKIAEVVTKTLETMPAGATHWSTRSMARTSGVSISTVHRIWNAFSLAPHRSETFKLSTDPQFVEKVRDIVGLYLNPPERALVLCVDEKSQIQALDRTQPGLPLKKGRCGTMTHDYKRNGTTTLLAAIELLEGKVIGQCYQRHRHQEFLRFLRRLDQEFPTNLGLHLVIDNYGTHSHPEVAAWLQQHPRFVLHLVPTSCSWLNLIERWFRALTTKRIRRDSLPSVP